MKIALALLFLPALLFGGEVMESSYALPDGKRVLRHDVLVAAPVEKVYEAMFGSASEIVAYVPNEMIAMRAAKDLRTVVQFIRIADPNTTRVRMSTLAFGIGAEWDEPYEGLRRENAERLRRLEEKFAK